jgi:hypothetical protein
VKSIDNHSYKEDRKSKKQKTFILRNICQLLVGITSLSLMTSCASDSPPDPKLPTSPVKEQTSVKEVRFFLDATESMLGFASQASYLEFMKDLEDSVTELSDANQTIHKYRFASTVDCSDNSLDKQRAIDIVKQKDFYRGTKQVTRIDNVLNQKCVPDDRSNLSIIITDLFQEGTDSGAIVAKLEPYLKQGLAVGLIGIESDFDGNIWDYATNNYSTQPIQHKGSRPVYAMVIGDVSAVREYFDSVKRLSKDAKVEQNFTIFTSQSFDNKINFFRSGISPLSWSNNLTYQGQLGNTPIQKFTIKEDDVLANLTICANKPNSISQDLAGNVDFPTDFEPEITIEKKSQKNDSKSVNSESITATTEVVNLEQIANSKTSKNKTIDPTLEQCRSNLKKASISATEPLAFKINIIPKELRTNNGSDGHYLVSIVFKPKVDRALTQWDKWSTESVKDNPDRTLSLARFIKNLSTTTVTIGQEQKETAIIFYLTKGNTN